MTERVAVGINLAEGVAHHFMLPVGAQGIHVKIYIDSLSESASAINRVLSTHCPRSSQQMGLNEQEQPAFLPQVFAIAMPTMFS